MKLALAGLLLAAGLAQAGHAFVRFGPPAPVREMMVARPGPRHVWVPGYYRWRGNRYSWVRGAWMQPPRGRSAWVPGYWAQRPGGFVWIAGVWR